MGSSDIGESPSGKAPDFDSGIRRFDPYLPSQIKKLKRVSLTRFFVFAERGARGS